MLLAGGSPASAAPSDAEAAQKSPVDIAIFLTSRTDFCYDRGDVPAIKRLAKREQERINRQGGIAGRALRLHFLDDERDGEKAVANMRSALANPSTLAMIGLTGSDRAKTVFDAVGDKIKASRIPFLSTIGLNDIFKGYANVFSASASQADDWIPVMLQFLKSNNVSRPAYVGLASNEFSSAMGNELTRALGEGALVADHRLRTANAKVDPDEKLDPAAVAAMIADLKEKNPDLVFLSVFGSRGEGNRTESIIKELIAANLAPVLFVAGRIDLIAPDILDRYANDLYQLTFDRLPEIYNDRLRRRISRTKSEDWIFEGRKVRAAPGWKTGACKPRPQEDEPEVFSEDNMWAIGRGTQFADMVALVAEAARAGGPNADIPALRSRVLDALGKTYESGKGVFQGRFVNWSFKRSTHTATRVPLLLQRLQSLKRIQLAPLQFVRLRDGALRPIDTLYLDIDLVKASRIDDNEKVFLAEFYLAMRDDGKGASIDSLEFSNAFLDPQTNDRQVTIRVLSKGGKSAVYPDDMKIYQVSGKFMFQPTFANYPFDTQRFSIDIRPKSGDAPFIVQPPPQSLRDRAVNTDGWIPKEFYVGYDEDFVPTVDAKTHERGVAPFYKATFVWLMKREITDYFLRVVVPLGFILVVAYLSIFIPSAHFEAIVTIQVTALLSAVALYLSLPQVNAETTTLSDRIFLFTYMADSLMIAISIARVSRFVAARPALRKALAALYIIGIPALVTLMAMHVYRESLAA